MNYTIQGGRLSASDSSTPLAVIKNEYFTRSREILSAKNEVLGHTSALNDDTDGNISHTTYSYCTAEGKELLHGEPHYAENEDPEYSGWPVARMPLVDHADVTLYDQPYELYMQNSQNYVLKDTEGHPAVQIMHRGIIGGWDIQTAKRFAPDILCALFVFCRYIEQENEMPLV